LSTAEAKAMPGRNRNVRLNSISLIARQNYEKPAARANL
jgi:hypothetical protein